MGEKMDITKGEAYAIAEFIDMNLFEAIRSDTEWDSVQNLRNLVHGYEKLCEASGYVGVTETGDGGMVCRTCAWKDGGGDE